MKAALTFEIYRAKNRQYGWRARRKNGRILADSGETYTRKASLQKALGGFIASILLEDYAVVESKANC